MQTFSRTNFSNRISKQKQNHSYITMVVSHRYCKNLLQYTRTQGKNIYSNSWLEIKVPVQKIGSRLEAALNLDNIISILILCQHAYRLQYLIHNYLLCFWISTVLKYSLYREKKTVNLTNTRIEHLHVGAEPKGIPVWLCSHKGGLIVEQHDHRMLIL